MTNQPTNHDVVAAHYAASDRGDLDGMLAPLEPDTTWTEAAGSTYAGTYVGRDEVRDKIFSTIGADWDGFAFTLANLLDAGDTVVALGSYSGTHRRTGRSFSARVAHVWTFADGRLASFEQIVDSATMNVATD
ncbi:MAG: nuclear transport factor 2 family protein [Pseudonocardia sp.]